MTTVQLSKRTVTGMERSHDGREKKNGGPKDTGVARDTDSLDRIRGARQRYASEWMVTSHQCQLKSPDPNSLLLVER